MRISVECGGYTEAAGVCRTANQIAALSTESLAGITGASAPAALPGAWMWVVPSCQPGGLCPR